MVTWCVIIYSAQSKIEQLQLEGGRDPPQAVFEWLEQYYGTCVLISCWRGNKALVKDIQFWFLIQRENSPFFSCSCFVWKAYSLTEKNIYLNGYSRWGKWGGKWGWWFVSSLRLRGSPASAGRCSGSGFPYVERSCWACHARLSICIPSTWYM